MMDIHRLCGFPPFYEENNQKLFEMIKSCTFEFPSPYWDEVSETAKDLIRQCLVFDPSKRLTAEQILAHPWVNGEIAPVKILGSVPEKMRQYNIKRKFKVTSFICSKNNLSIEKCLHGNSRT
jgi:serine/threonine protein kinase